MPSDQRLHPTSILFGLIGQIREFFVPLLLAVVAGSQRDDYDMVAWIVLIPYTLLAVGRYFWFSYRFDAHELVVRSGLIVRNERHIPYARIQNLDAVQNLLHRLLGVVDVRIDTGSGADTDARLSVVTWQAYADMRHRVFEGRESVSDTAEDQATGPLPHELVHLSPRDLATFGLIENRGSIVIAGLMGLLWEAGIGERFVEQYAGETAAAGGTLRELLTGAQGGLWPRLAVAAVVILGILLLIRLLSIVIVFVRLYGFRVVRAGEDLRTEYGFFTRVSATIPLRRVQTLTVSDGVLHRLFGRSSIRVDTAGGEGRQGGSSRRESLAPVIAREAVPAFVHEVLPELDLASVHWQPVADGAFTREARRRVVVAGVVSLVAAYFWQWWAVAVFAALAGWGILAASRYVAHLGWAVVDGAVLYRSGWLSRHLTIARFTRIQNVEMWQSPFDRRWSMARVGVDTAGANAGSHRVHVPYLTLGEADRLYRDLSTAAAGTAFHW